jgi:O-acetyl-ADP-ribose deacetylase (regulator of RNase III)
MGTEQDLYCLRNWDRLLFTAESFGGWDGGGVAGGQQAGEDCAEREERSGGKQTACGKAALHPVGEDGAEKAVNGNTNDNARSRA